MAMTASDTRTARFPLFLVTAASVLVTVGGTGAFASGPAVAASRTDRAAPVTLATPAKQAVAVGTGGAVGPADVQAAPGGGEGLRARGGAAAAAAAGGRGLLAVHPHAAAC